MRKGGNKRKASQRGREEAKPDNHKEEEEAKATTQRRKQVRASEPQSEPEYLEDPRRLEDQWKAAFLVGTEWELLDSVYQCKWDFSNLEQAFEEEGRLCGIGNNKVYLFGATEPAVSISSPDLVSLVVAIVSPCPPSSDLIGVSSIQSAVEDVIPMKQMKMDWIPHIPLDKRDSQVIEHRLKSPQIFVLGCTIRRWTVS